MYNFFIVKTENGNSSGEDKLLPRSQNAQASSSEGGESGRARPGKPLY